MKKVRCAIYTRKSSEEGLEQSFNSLHAQQEACAAYILSQASEGWSLLPGAYDDGGLSGGSLERPALQRLLADIASGKIDIVVVYKVDRLTRSLLDFAKLVEAFDKAGTSFVSVTQSFNTTTSMGRLTLNMLLSFAQFEREVTAERIRDKIAASKAKGMWMGGNPPLGYKPDGRTLAIVEEHAALVRDIFGRYLEAGNVRLVAEQLRREQILTPVRTAITGRRSGGCAFSRGMIYKMLGNAMYIGEIRHREMRYPAQHPPIIDRATWDAVQEMLAGNVRGERHGRAGARSLLAGRIFDEQGEPLLAVHASKAVPNSSSGNRRYRYYVSRDLHFKQSTDGMRLPAKEVEAAVCQRVAAAFADPIALLTGAGIPLSGLDLNKLLSRAAQIEQTTRAGAFAPLDKLLLQVRVLADGIEIDMSASHVAVLLGADQLQHDRAITIAAPVRLTRTGRAMRLVTGNGNAATANAPEDTIVRLLQKARAWWKRICEERLNPAELARLEGTSKTYVRSVTRLAMLSPAIVEQILGGSHGAMLTATRLVQIRDLPVSWDEQERLIRSLG